MTTIPSPLDELLQSQKQEITMYKWIESERLGFDIGWERATSEWFDLHFADWVLAQRRMIDEALSGADYDTHLSSGSSTRVTA